MLKKTLSLLSLLFLAYFIITWPKPKLLDGISYSQLFYDSQGKLLRMTLSADQQYRVYIPITEIAPTVIQATLCKEDRYFYWHLGINPWSLFKAAWHSYLKHDYHMGASTLTMQVARLRYHLNTRTLSGKLTQMIDALRLERHYSKQAILTAYFNLAPYGNNIEGIGAASLIYFHQTAKTLNLPEALTLSIIPQNPETRHTGTKALQAIDLARQQLFQRWCQQHPEDKALVAQMQLPLSLFNLKNLPFLAPHFVNRILSFHPQQLQVFTTLDLSLQQLLENKIALYIRQKKSYGINNISALLVDSRDMQVKALVGSADYFSASILGQNNGTIAMRSPGSTLKPFIYALALDQGLIHPASILNDTPQHFGNYDPENFDRDFLGPVSAQQALILSRNIPAILLADQLKNPTFYQFLAKLNLVDKPEKHYGLSLVLGGAEISMAQLVQLYAMLTNGGVYHSLIFWRGQEQTKSLRLLSPEASYLTLNMLQHEYQSDSFIENKSLLRSGIAWKTGTSSGFRDAWSVGIIGPYVLAVWVGNFNGQSNPSFTGINAAAPLFFNIVNDLTRQVSLSDPNVKFDQLNIKKVLICTASGMLPTRDCPETSFTLFIPGKSPIKKDTVFREVMINPKTGLRACHFSPENYFKVYEFWPSDLLAVFKRAGIGRLTPPPYDKGCPMRDDPKDQAPQIISPSNTVTYALRESTELIIPLQVIGNADVHQWHWFVDQQYLGASAREEVLWWHPKTPGKYIIRVVDELGHATAVDVVIV